MQANACHPAYHVVSPSHGYDILLGGQLLATAFCEQENGLEPCGRRMPGWPTCVGSGDSPPWGRVPSVTSAASSGPPPGFALPDFWDQHSPRQKLCHADGLLPDAGFNPMGFPGGAGGKETACQLRRCKRCEFDLWVGKTPWRRAWQPILALFPGEYPCTVEPDRVQTYWEESDTTERSSTGCLTVGTSCCALSCEL